MLGKEGNQEFRIGPLPHHRTPTYSASDKPHQIYFLRGKFEMIPKKEFWRYGFRRVVPILNL